MYNSFIPEFWVGQPSAGIHHRPQHHTSLLVWLLPGVPACTTGKSVRGEGLGIGDKISSPVFRFTFLTFEWSFLTFKMLLGHPGCLSLLADYLAWLLDCLSYFFWYSDFLIWPFDYFYFQITFSTFRPTFSSFSLKVPSFRHFSDCLFHLWGHLFRLFSRPTDYFSGFSLLWVTFLTFYLSALTLLMLSE